MKNKYWEYRKILLEWEKTHMLKISADHHTKEDGSNWSYSSYNTTLMGRYINNIKICIRRELIIFVGIDLLITQMTWLLLKQVQEIISSFGLEFTLMIGFGTLTIWSYVSWDNYMLLVRKY